MIDPTIATGQLYMLFFAARITHHNDKIAANNSNQCSLKNTAKMSIPLLMVSDIVSCSAISLIPIEQQKYGENSANFTFEKQTPFA
jgi:hypothetical protein